jgi:hypothetical protein
VGACTRVTPSGRGCATLYAARSVPAPGGGLGDSLRAPIKKSNAHGVGLGARTADGSSLSAVQRSVASLRLIGRNANGKLPGADAAHICGGGEARTAVGLQM